MAKTPAAIKSRSGKILNAKDEVWIKCRVLGIEPAQPAQPAILDAQGVETQAAQPAQPARVQVVPIHAKRVKGVVNPVVITIEPTVVEH